MVYQLGLFASPHNQHLFGKIDLIYSIQDSLIE